MTPLILALVKPTPLGDPRVERGQAVHEDQPWGLAPSERRVVAAALQAAQALGAEVAALAAGPPEAEAGLREALALGAHRAALVQAAEPLDALATARALAAGARRLGAPAVVVAGVASPDLQQGAVGAMVAELLGLDLVEGVEGLKGQGGKLTLTAGDGDRLAAFEAAPPLAFTASPRFQPTLHATSWGVGQAMALPLAVWTPKDLGLPAPAPSEATQVLTLARAEQARGEAERFEGDAEEATGQLVRRLRAAGVVR